MKSITILAFGLVACLIGLVGLIAGIRYHSQKIICQVAVVTYDDWLQKGGRDLKVGEMDLNLDFDDGKYRDDRKHCYFAIRGEVAQRFVPWEFRSIYADIKSRKADEQCVYIHSYNRKYLISVNMP